jgi:hypothetical protein
MKHFILVFAGLVALTTAAYANPVTPSRATVGFREAPCSPGKKDQVKIRVIVDHTVARGRANFKPGYWSELEIKENVRTWKNTLQLDSRRVGNGSRKNNQTWVIHTPRVKPKFVRNNRFCVTYRSRIVKGNGRSMRAVSGWSAKITQCFNAEKTRRCFGAVSQANVPATRTKSCPKTGRKYRNGDRCCAQKSPWANCRSI